MDDDRPFAWLSLTEAHNEPALLVTDVVCALQASAPCGEDTPIPRLSSLVRAVAGHPRPFVLVLDDTHVLWEPACMTTLSTIATHLPPGSQIAIAGRCEPALPVSRWCLEGDLLRIGTADLAMTRAEAGALMAAANIDLAPGELEVLLRRTEGWPAGLSFAALALVEQPDRAGAIGSFAGDDRLVASYLQDEVLGQLAPDLVNFLTRTSVLDRLSGPLCDAVLDEQGSGAVLRRLEGSNHFLIPLDRRQEWYRCHRLLADVLRADLHRQHPTLEVELHRRASSWYEAHEDPGRAIRHLQAAGHVGRAAELVWANLLTYFGHGRLATVRGWIDGFSEAEVAGHPALALSAAWCSVEGGDAAGAQRWTAAAELGSPGGGVRLEAGLAILRASIGRDGVANMCRDAAHGFAAAEAGSPLCCVGRLMEGVAWRLCGDRHRARNSLDAVERLAAGIPAPAILAQCLAQLALLAVEQDDWEQSESHVTRAKAQVERHGLQDLVTRIMVSTASSLVLAKQGQAGHARSEIRQTSRLLGALSEVRPWVAVDARITLAQASLLLADAPAALVFLSEARRRLSRAGDLGALRGQLEATWDRATAFRRSGVVAPSPLSRAELRILRLLPTHFSYREIGERLHVSQCTVKSQALSVYRKLEVRSRSEAVERASTLGLIPC
jgi:LuxR family maltose regulon positive regulatory protein